MTLGDRFGRRANRHHQPYRPTPAAGAPASPPDSPPLDQPPIDEAPFGTAAPRPAFGPEPPRAHQDGPAFPGSAGYRKSPTDRAAPSYPGPDTDPVDHAFASWFTEPAQPDDGWPVSGGTAGAASPRPTAFDAGDLGEPIDPFGDAAAGAPFWHVQPDATERAAGQRSARTGPTWADPAAEPDRKSAPPEDSPDDASSDRPADPTPEPGDAGQPDEVLPPAGDTPAGAADPHPKQVVAGLQPAKVYRPSVPVDIAEPAGDPPDAARTAAVLSGILALPMLATAGTLFGGMSEGTGSFGVLLPFVTLLLAASCIVGGVRLLSRGSPLVSLFNATMAVVVGAGSLFRLLTPNLLNALLAGLWILAAPLALIMVVLLRARRVRRWLTDRSREWQASRPAPRRRRYRLPRLPHLRLPRIRLPRRRAAATRRPTRVRQVGRHTRGPRFAFLRRGPVSYVGSDSPDAGRAGD